MERQIVSLKPITPHIENLEQFLGHCHRRRYPAKSTLIYAGDSSDTLYYIISGSVTVLIEDDDGREMIVAYLNPGDFAVPGFGLKTNAMWPKLATTISMR